MTILFEDRLSDSPLIDRIWRSSSPEPGPFISPAGTRWMMVITNYNGVTSITMRGPETHATPAYCPEHGTDESEFFGIEFKPGVFMPHMLPGKVADRNDIVLPEAAGKSFWLYGSTWQFPRFDNADTFIDRLMREDILARDPLVDAALNDEVIDLTPRSIQMRFLRATGITLGTFRQIERAHHAVSLLQQGTAILDTVFEAGYFDQPHLTRSLKRFMGQTPAQILRA